MLKRIDRLILQELVGPWAFGVAMFSSLLLAGTYLGRIADYIVSGVPPALIGKITLMFMPAILVKTFAMAILLAALLSFGRLSGDSEIVALRASGASVYRILFPVCIFAALIAIVSFAFNETIVPGAAKQSTSLVKEVAKSLQQGSIQPTAQPQMENGKLKAMIVAKDFNVGRGSLEGVQITAYDGDGKPTFIMFADQLTFRDRRDWRISGGAELLAADGSSRAKIEGDVWPSQVPKIASKPEEFGQTAVNDPDYYSAGELYDQLKRAEFDKTLTPEQYRNREFWFWNKFAVPLAAFVFGTLGAALGIRSHRTSSAAGFALAIAIIFGYMTLASFMNVFAQGGRMPAYVASFTPVVLGLGASLAIMKRRNIG